MLTAAVKAWNAGSVAVLADPSASTVGCNLIVWCVVSDPVTCFWAHV